MKAQDIFLQDGLKTGPTVSYYENSVSITWKEAKPRKRNLLIVPPIVEWTEADGGYYELGKRIYESFLNK